MEQLPTERPGLPGIPGSPAPRRHQAQRIRRLADRLARLVRLVRRAAGSGATSPRNRPMTPIPKGAAKPLLFSQLEPLRRRVRFVRTLRAGITGVAAGLLFAVLLALTARLLPIPDYRSIALALLAGGGLIGVAWGFLRSVRYEEAAAAADRLTPGSNAAVTAIAYWNSEQPVARLQREEGFAAIESANARVRDAVPFPAERRRFAAMAAVAGLLAGLLLLPNPQDAVVQKLREERQLVQEGQKQVEEIAERIEKAELPEAAKKPLAEALASLKEGLREAKDSKEALAEMEKALASMQKQLEEAEKLEAAAKRFAEELQKDSSLKALGDSLMKQSQQDLAKAGNELKQNVVKMSEEQKQALARELERLSKQVPQGEASKAVQEALQKAASELQKGGTGEANSAALADAMKQLEASLQEAMEEGKLNDQLSQLAAAEGKKLAELGLSAAERLAASSGNPASGTWAAGGSAQAMANGQPGTGSSSPGSSPGASPAPGNGSGTSTGTGQGNGKGAGNGSGSGQGQGNGNGNGSGSGQGNGSGSGSGSGNGSGSGSGQGQGSGAGWGAGSRNLVSTPRTMQGTGSVTNDGGPAKPGQGPIEKGGSAPAIDGTTRPYQEVYRDYKTAAKSSLERNPLPQNLQNLVRDYFTEINPD